MFGSNASSWKSLEGFCANAALIEVEYGSTTGPLGDDELDCQKEIAKNGAKYANARLKAIQKCRNDINKGKIFGVPPRLCATNNQKASDAIAKGDAA